MSFPDLITIIGPTASGKTGFAAALALETNGEIISGDSRQVYSGMDIGTGKDLEEYTIKGVSVPYHLIDIHPPGYKYNVFEFQQDFHRVYNEIKHRGRTPILCGGSGMYIEAVLKGYNLFPVPENKELREGLGGKSLAQLTEILRTYKVLHNTTDIDTCKRAIRAIEIEEFYQSHPVEKFRFPEVKSILLGLHIEREERRKRISVRLRKRLEEGMIEEVKRILETGVSSENLIYYGLEYKYITLYLLSQITYEEMVKQLEIAIHQFAKRQMTWFRGMEKKGFIIHWIDALLPLEEKILKAKEILNTNLLSLKK
ncbi:MAG: tRNA (adenosine(37)-N6)-dimethylallyltransferase MiaA [Candidatus Azobacteroides sp.]|nr:tRNA (adenosine(37)-N6)-dimethylallyltransferase MiaA [Candidatus Azobacteroides sp.]